MYYFIFIIFLIVLLFLFVYSQEFTYDLDICKYPKGTAITANKPSVSGGTFSVYPNLPTGLSIDATTGHISGTPTQIEEGIFTITQTSGSITKTCTLFIYIYEKPSNVNCGLTKMIITGRVSTTLTCTGSGGALEWSHAPEFDGIYQLGNTIVFNNFELARDRGLAVIATNPAGSDSVTITLSVNINPTYLDGIYVSVFDLQTTTCSDMNDGLSVFTKTSARFSDLSGLETFDNWRSKGIYLYGILTAINGTMVGYLNAETAGTYTLYLVTGGYWGVKMTIDGYEELNHGKIVMLMIQTQRL